MNRLTHINVKLAGLCFGLLVAFVPSLALAANLNVTFTPNPLFTVDTFAPGDTISGTVVVGNESGKEQTILTDSTTVTNDAGPNGGVLGDAITLRIYEGSTSTSPIVEETLTSFFAAKWVLGTSTDSAATTYIYEAEFEAASGNTYQDATLGFDLCVGFSGTEFYCGGTEVDQGGGGEGGDDNKPIIISSGSSGGAPDGGTPQTQGATAVNPLFFPGLGGAFPTSDGDGAGDGGEGISNDQSGNDADGESEDVAGEDNSNLAAVAGAEIDFTNLSCTTLLFLILAAMMALWSFVDDYVRSRNVAHLLRNLGFAAVFAIGALSFEALGALEAWRWLFLFVWFAAAIGDYVYHGAVLDSWSARPRNIFYAAISLAAILLTLTTSLLCAWLPFAIIFLASTVLFFLHE